MWLKAILIAAAITVAILAVLLWLYWRATKEL